MTYLYVEPTTQCRLACPRCVRTYLRSSYRPAQLDVDLLVERLAPVGHQIKKIEFGGNYGDPIYHPQFLSMVRRLKTAERQIVVHTNGAHQTSVFWQGLSETLDERDVILFSVDGLQETNALYRRGSDWSTIETAFRVLHSSRAMKVWKFIVFAHNQTQIDEAKEAARRWGFKKFLVIKSSLFGRPWAESLDSDPLAPAAEWRSNGTQGKSPGVLQPRCQTASHHFISASAHYFPCCWIGHAHNFQNTFIEPELEQLQLKNHSIAEILASPLLRKLKESFVSSPLAVCRSSCTQSATRSARSIHENLEFDLSLSHLDAGLNQQASPDTLPACTPTSIP